MNRNICSLTLAAFLLGSALGNASAGPCRVELDLYRGWSSDTKVIYVYPTMKERPYLNLRSGRFNLAQEDGNKLVSEVSQVREWIEKVTKCDAVEINDSTFVRDIGQLPLKQLLDFL